MMGGAASKQKGKEKIDKGKLVNIVLCSQKLYTDIKF